MFDNPGTKIKKVSIILFLITSIVCIILAFVLGIEIKYHYSHFNAGIFFGFILGGPLISYVCTLLLVGFGELVENSKNSSVHSVATEVSQTPFCVKNVSACADKTESTENSTFPVVNEWGTGDEDNNYTQCPRCMTWQPKSRRNCIKCGAPVTLKDN